MMENHLLNGGESYGLATRKRLRQRGLKMVCSEAGVEQQSA